ncbi:PAS domain-containing protein [Heliobacterium undosum]|uniref:PAS domain-containing protein n=1 Tax=Heliomicrobium undosum TaxID=121734 RepID=A0A845L6V8_9FIRM|nr:PAS domain-containing protein [Heliomicrobium undosum]MZP28631.1 PAS domain-containing protein [Heliomicrobium undosum]
MEPWSEGLPAAITVCDREGVIVAMNEQAGRLFAKSGGKDLIGKNLLDCHPEKAQAKIRDLMEQQKANCYTIEKNGVKKMIYQAPWYADGEYQGLVEMAFEIPYDMSHFKR